MELPCYTEPQQEILVVVPSHCPPWVLLGGNHSSWRSPECPRVLGLLVVGAGQEE